MPGRSDRQVEAGCIAAQGGRIRGGDAGGHGGRCGRSTAGCTLSSPAHALWQSGVVQPLWGTRKPRLSNSPWCARAKSRITTLEGNAFVPSGGGGTRRPGCSSARRPRNTCGTAALAAVTEGSPLSLWRVGTVRARRAAQHVRGWWPCALASEPGKRWPLARRVARPRRRRSPCPARSGFVNARAAMVDEATARTAAMLVHGGWHSGCG